MSKRVCAAGLACVVAALASSAFASDIELIKGRLAPTPFAGEFDQFLSVKNNGHQIMTVMVECGFLKVEGLQQIIVDTGSDLILNLEPGQTAYGRITVHGPFDRAECRIAHARP
jgi:hypothetical protein